MKLATRPGDRRKNANGNTEQVYHALEPKRTKP